MSKSFLGTMLAISLFWLLLLLGHLRTSSFTHVLKDSWHDSLNEFGSVSCPLFGGEESRMVRLDKEWGPVLAGDTLEIRFVGFSTGSKSTITGGYSWIHRRGNQELGRSSRSLMLFWPLFILVGVVPVLLFSALLGRKLRKESRAPDGPAILPDSTARVKAG